MNAKPRLLRQKLPNAHGILTAVTLFTASPVSALQPVEEAARPSDIIYTQEYFSQFSPRSAFDMVNRIPGFSIVENEENERGLGMADINVLFNGRRLSGKSLDPVSVLENISAEDVVRIELKDASSFDVQGLGGKIANIVYSTGTDVSGRFRYQPSLRPKTAVNWANGSASVNGKSGASEWSIGLESQSRRGRGEGPEFTRSALHEILAIREEVSAFNRDAPKLTATFSRRPEGGVPVNVNLALERIRSSQRLGSDVFVEGVRTAHENLDISSARNSAELGGDIEFVFGSGTLKVIGLVSRASGSSNGLFAADAASPTPTRFTRSFARKYDEGEAVIRAEYRWSSGVGDLQIGAEAALNELEDKAKSRFIRNGAVSELPPFNGSVSEKRGELIASLSRPLGNRLDIQSNAGFEISRLSAGLSSAADRTFLRPKGALTLSWRAPRGFSLNTKVERSVDQISFFDFLADVDLANDFDRGNNPELVPPQRWTISSEARWQPAPWLTLAPEASVAFFEDVIESVPISPTREALGNLASAQMVRLGGKATILSEVVGFDGARLDLEGVKAFSRVEDPLTGETRPLNNALDYAFSIRLRHDISGSKWAWGGELFQRQSVATLRLTEMNLRGLTKPFGGLFIEHKDVAGMTLTVWLNNILNARSTFESVNYVDRRDGPIDTIESYSRKSGRFIQFSLAGSF